MYRELFELFFFFFNDTATTEIYTLSYTTLFRSRPSVDVTRVDGSLAPTDGRDLRRGEHGRRHRLEVERRDRVAERVPHRGATLHGRHRCEHEHAGAVAGGVDTSARRP